MVFAYFGDGGEDLTATASRLQSTKDILTSDLSGGSRPNSATWKQWTDEVLQYQEALEFVGNRWTEASAIQFVGTISKKLQCAGLVFPGPVTFNGCKFRAGCDFAGATFKQKVTFGTEDNAAAQTETEAAAGSAGCRFSRPTHFNGAIFEGAADFTGAVFVADVDFSGAKFLKSADFSRIECQKQFEFSEVVCKEASTFANATFSDTASFVGTEIYNSAHFDEAQFCGDALFTSFQLGGPDWPDASFSALKSKFNQTANFRDATFIGDANFAGAAFSNECNFEGARVEPLASGERRGLDLSSCTFSGPVNFKGCSIGTTGSNATLSLDASTFEGAGAAHFAELQVQGYLSFDGATVNKVIDVSHSKIGNLLGRNVKFHRSANFSHLKISGQTNLTKSTFDDVDFISATFGNDPDLEMAADFSGCKFNGFASFRGAVFRRDPLFRGIKCESAFELDDVSFLEVAPDFTLSLFKIPPNLARLSYSDSKNGEPDTEDLRKFYNAVEEGRRGTPLDDRFRALRTIAIRGHDVDRRRLYTKLEAQAGQRKIGERLLEWVYDLVSRSGESVTRPLLLLLFMCFLVFPTAYVLCSQSGSLADLITSPISLVSDRGCFEKTGAINPVIAALYRSIRDTVVIGPADDGMLDAASKCLNGRQISGVAGLIAVFVSYLQILISFVLLFLMALGVRHKLRIESLSD